MPLYHHIVEAHQPFPNPLSPTQALELAQMCELHSGTRLLDLRCGRGEMLNLWAQAHQIQGTGVDEDKGIIQQAMTRANELEVWSQVQFVVDTVLDYPQSYHQYNIVSLLGGGLGNIAEGLQTMRQALRDNENGLLLVGESFWWRTPPPEVCEGLGVSPQDLLDLSDLVDVFSQQDTQLQEMLLVSPTHWDSYYTRQWRTLNEWLKDNAFHPDAPVLWEQLGTARRSYLRYEREYVGWGVFVLEAMGNRTANPTPPEDEKPPWLD